MYRGLGIDREALLQGQMDCVISSTVNREGRTGKENFIGKEEMGEGWRKTDMSHQSILFDQNVLHN